MMVLKNEELYFFEQKQALSLFTLIPASDAVSSDQLHCRSHPIPVVSVTYEAPPLQ